MRVIGLCNNNDDIQTKQDERRLIFNKAPHLYNRLTHY